MPIQFGSNKIGAMQYGGVTIGEAMYNGQVVYKSGPPVVTLTGTSGSVSRDQFRQACIDYGTTYDTVETLPFLLDISQATVLTRLFQFCESLTHVPDLDTSHVTSTDWMFQGCASLTDGNVRCIGKHPNVYLFGMIRDSGLTREPFYDTNGNPI